MEKFASLHRKKIIVLHRLKLLHLWRNNPREKHVIDFFDKIWSELNRKRQFFVFEFSSIESGWEGKKDEQEREFFAGSNAIDSSILATTIGYSTFFISRYSSNEWIDDDDRHYLDVNFSFQTLTEWFSRYVARDHTFDTHIVGLSQLQALLEIRWNIHSHVDNYELRTQQ